MIRESREFPSREYSCSTHSYSVCFHRHPKSTVGVFFCGPSVMSKLLYEQCRKHSNEAFTVFKYHKENF